MTEPRPPRYLKPMNKFMMAVQRLGIPTGPAMVLTVPGRKTGQPRSTPMTPFDFQGGLYVVAG
ncbi:nitroreductase/quinone reductase family protein, partial [Mycobacterium kansasii]